MTVTVDDISRLIASHEGSPLPPTASVRAAVAMILRTTGNGLELLFIERAQHAGDPWSGNLGFPGGKVEQTDTDPRRTAEREAREEVSLDLSAARHIGFLAEIAGAHLPVRVSCYVYEVTASPSLILNGEVVDAFWVPLAALLDPRRHCRIPIPFRGETLPRPAIRLPQHEKPYLWGITYRLVMELLHLLDFKAVA